MSSPEREVNFANPNASQGSQAFGQGHHHDEHNPKASDKKKITKPYIIHRSANSIIVAGQNQMFKTERVSYNFSLPIIPAKLEFPRLY